MQVEFVDSLPPSRARGYRPITRKNPGVMEQIRTQLRERPGQWAITYRSTTKTGAQMNTWAHALKFAGSGGVGRDIDAVIRTVDGEARVYARAVIR